MLKKLAINIIYKLVIALLFIIVSPIVLLMLFAIFCFLLIFTKIEYNQIKNTLEVKTIFDNEKFLF